jgi:hypothetical protein
MHLMQIQPTASGLRLGPDIVITSGTDKRHGNQTVAIFVRDGTQDVGKKHSFLDE